jgi:hypothetical protein
MPLVRICGGGYEQSSSLLRLRPWALRGFHSKWRVASRSVTFSMPRYGILQCGPGLRYALSAASSRSSEVLVSSSVRYDGWTVKAPTVMLPVHFTRSVAATPREVRASRSSSHSLRSCHSRERPETESPVPAGRCRNRLAPRRSLFPARGDSRD